MNLADKLFGPKDVGSQVKMVTLEEKFHCLPRIPLSLGRMELW
jgi:hypothetical protein